MSDYTPSGNPVAQSRGTSPSIRAEFQLIATAVNSKPDLDTPNTFTSPQTFSAGIVTVGGTYTGANDFSGGTVVVPTPTLATHAVTKAYADALSMTAGNVATGGTVGQVYKKNSSTNYDAVWTSPEFAYLKVSDQKASATSGGTSLASDITQVRTLNTVETNTISGASLASNTVTLPAGTYSYRISAPHYNGQGHKAFLYNSTDATYTGIGTSEKAVAGATVGSTNSLVSGQFTIASSKDFKVRHYTGVSSADGLGFAVGTGQVEVYTVAEFWKIA